MWLGQARTTPVTEKGFYHAAHPLVARNVGLGGDGAETCGGSAGRTRGGGHVMARGCCAWWGSWSPWSRMAAGPNLGLCGPQLRGPVAARGAPSQRAAWMRQPWWSAGMGSPPPPAHAGWRRGRWWLAPLFFDSDADASSCLSGSGSSRRLRPGPFSLVIRLRRHQGHRERPGYRPFSVPFDADHNNTCGVTSFLNV